MILAGVVGYPISQSLSPKLHGYWLDKYALNGAYVPLPVAVDDFENVITTLPKMGFHGVNVTIPHKQTALRLADEVTETAREIGASNTLFFDDGRILADNTDAYGFMANIEANVPDWNPKSKALVIGAGGAARAVIYGLLSRGCSKIYLSNRSLDKAETLAEHFGEKVNVITNVEIEKHIPDVDLLVNTTSLGMTGYPPLEIDLAGSKKSCVITDIVYNPLITPLIRSAEQQGLSTVTGIGMLLHQAVPGFEGWFGKRPVVDDELERLILG
ncbi:shikimate dehydrogenase [Paracoccaceae bacterium GXU_MW_L88]